MREILDVIEDNYGPMRLDLSHKYLWRIDLSRARVRAELEKIRTTNSEANPKRWSRLTRTVILSTREEPGEGIPGVTGFGGDDALAGLEKRVTSQGVTSRWPGTRLGEGICRVANPSYI